MIDKKNTLLQSFRKLVLFGFNGIINFVVSYSLFVVISNIIDYRITVVIVYIIGIFLAYFLNRRTVFKVSGRLYLFIVIHIGMLLLNLTITTVLVEEFNLIKELAQLIAIFIVFGIAYILINRYAFPNQKSTNR